MSDISKATPRPWRINKYGSIGAGERGHEPIIANIEPFYGDDLRFGGSHSANAALIVRAVNAHDALVEALRAIADGEGDAQVIASQTLARAGIALAEGKP